MSLGYDRIGMDLEGFLSYAQKNWSGMDTDMREKFRNTLESNIIYPKDVAQFFDIFETHFICNGNIALIYLRNRIRY